MQTPGELLNSSFPLVASRPNISPPPRNSPTITSFIPSSVISPVCSSAHTDEPVTVNVHSLLPVSPSRPYA